MSVFEKKSHKGKQICVVDIANTNPAEAIIALEEAHKHIATLAPKSGLILTDVTNAVYNSDSAGAMKTFVSKNTPYVKASAVVGIDGMRAVLLRTIALFSKREIKACKTREEAMEWLAGVA